MGRAFDKGALGDGQRLFQNGINSIIVYFVIIV
jgi:hypothetical protein